MPRFWTVPPRHTEPQEGCPRCGAPAYPEDMGCGDQRSSDILDWATGIGYDLDPWQRWSITQSMGVRPDGKWAAFQNGLIVNRQNGKGREALTNKVYTRLGWTTFMNVRPGDEVIGSDGKFTRVLYRSPVIADADCYEVSFSDGASVTVSGTHLWHVKNNNRTSKWKTDWHDVSTEELYKSVGSRRPDNGRMEYNWRVRCDTVVDLPEAALPVDPYLLGYWLGDGAHEAARITCGSEDVAWTAQRLYRAGAKRSGHSPRDEPVRAETKSGSTALDLRFRLDAPYGDGFVQQIKKLGVYGNKRIPEIYLTASIAQRQLLLAGLMDSDGSITRNNKTPQCEFSTSFPALADGFHRLARSLGIRTTRKVRETALNGVRKKDNERFLFTAPFNPFEMPRKALRWRPPESDRHELMSITRITPVPSVPTRCIKVAAADGVYLTGELFTPTHNTILEVRELAGLFILGEKLIIHTAHEVKTNNEHFVRILEALEKNPSLSRRLKGKPHMGHDEKGITLRPKPVLILGSGSKWVRRTFSPRLRFLARSRSAARGFTCNCLVYDEAMILDAEAVAASMPTMAAVFNSQMWFTGSAGLEDSIQFGIIREKIVKDTKRLFGGEWSINPHKETCFRDRVNGRESNDYVICSEHDDRDDPVSWAKGNPGFGYRLTAEFTQHALETMVPAKFDRELLGVGQWPTAAASWKVIPEDLWKATTIPVLSKPGKLISFAVDVAPDGSSASIGAAWYLPDGKMIIDIPKDCSQAGTSWVLARLRELDLKYSAFAIVVPRDGPAAGLGDDIENMWPANPKWGTKVIRATVADQAAAFAWFKQQCKDRSRPLVHLSLERRPGMWNALGTAEVRVVGDGGETFSRRDSESDITPITAPTLAGWGTNKRRKEYDPLNSIG